MPFGPKTISFYEQKEKCLQKNQVLDENNINDTKELFLRFFFFFFVSLEDLRTFNQCKTQEVDWSIQAAQAGEKREREEKEHTREQKKIKQVAITDD